MYFLPPRLLSISTVSITAYATWNVGITSGDPWVGYPYQWTVTFNVVPQQHSSYLTPSPFVYTGTDIQVGDWIADLAAGLSVEIVSIVTASATQVTCIVEDVDRFNTFTDPTGQGTGIGSTGLGFCFTLNDESIPNLIPMSPLYGQLSQNLAWQMDQVSRFQYRNYLKTFYMVNQVGQSFNDGDIIVLGTDIYGNAVYSLVTANTSSVKAIVGQVSSSGSPGPDWFTFRPSGRIVTGLTPELPGLPGDLIYLSANGLTNTDNVATNYSNVAPTTWSTPMYIQLDSPDTGIFLNRGVETVSSLGYATNTYVVPDENTANTIIAGLNTGDQIMIDNSGYGEWTHTLLRYGALRTISTQDSSHVDAESLDVTITPSSELITVTVGNTVMSAIFMGNVSANRAVTSVNVNVTSQFTANAVITVGTADSVDIIMPNNLIDLTMLGAYAYTPTVEFSEPYTSVYAFVNYNGTNTGTATITVTYV